MSVFEYRLRDDVDRAEYQARGERMYALVTSGPSNEFIDMNVYATSDIEGVIIEPLGSLQGAQRYAI